MSLSRSLRYARRQWRYWLTCRRNHVEEKVAVFECYAGRTYSCSPRAIYLAMIADERFDDWELIWVFRSKTARKIRRALRPIDQPVEAAAEDLLVEPDPDLAEDGNGGSDLATQFSDDAIEELRRARIVTYGSREYYRSHARASHWIANYILPVHMQPRERQSYIQTWHGTPLKRLGCDLTGGKNALRSLADIHSRYIREGARVTWMLSPSPFVSEKLATAFNLIASGRQDIIVEEGYPRNDALASPAPKAIEAIKARLDLPRDKKVILYAPTWRDDQHASGVGYTYQAETDFDLLKRELGEEYIVLFRAHYLIANRFDFERYGGFLRDVSAVNDINDLYLVSDILVTDYSSVFFDYSNLHRPMVFYMYDLERYADDVRGFYLDLSELPGPIVRTEVEFIRAVREAGRPDAELAQRYQTFNERYNPLDDGRASNRVIDRLIASETGK